MKNEISTSSHKISLHDDGIVKAICITGDETIEKARELIETIKKITENKTSPLLVDMRQQKSISREARQFYSRKETMDTVTALALIVESAISKVLANFFLGLNKPPYPTRLFTVEAEAIEWLKGYLK
jgi:transcriptional regulatory protein LevR